MADLPTQFKAADKTSVEVRSYRDLIAWQKGVRLCVLIYKETERFPKSELYGLTQQMRRAAVSIASNIAEGWGRGTLCDYIRFLRTARGSLCELETQVTVASELTFMTNESANGVMVHTDECARILQGLIWSLEKKVEKQ